MADLIPPMLIKLQADVSELKTGLTQAQNSLKGLDDNVKTASTGMQNFMGKIKQVGATMGVAFAGTQILQFGKDVVMASSNMAESLSKVDVVFGQNAEAVKAWSETSATAMGMSKQAALEAAGTYGNLFQAFGMGQGPAQEMSTSLVQLASDMASFNNTSIDDAILALRSGLSGETEPLKKFGVALSEARLKEEAMSMGLIKSTKEALTPAAKAQASYALIMKDTKLAQGDYARTSDGTANTMRTLAAQFENAKVAIGDALMPAFRALLALLKIIIPIISSFGSFLKKNEDYVKALGIGIGVATAAFLAYKAVIIATSTASKVYAVMQVLMSGGQLASIASTNTLAASMLKLNATMYANPIGLVVAAIALLVAGFVLAYKKSETFRNIVGTVAKAVLTYVAFMIRAWGDMITIIMKVVTGPLKLFLTVISKLPGVGGAAKAGLKMIDGAIEGVGNFAETTAAKIEGLKKNVDGFTKSANESAKAGKKAEKDAKDVKDNKDGKGKGGLSADQKGKLENYKKDVLSTYKDMNEAIADAQEKSQEIVIEYNERKLEAHKDYDEKVVNFNKIFNERNLEAQKDYDEKVTNLNKNFNEANAEADKRYSEAIADAEKRRRDTETEAYKRHKETIQNIEKDYAEKKADLLKTNTEKLYDIRKKAEEKTADLIKAAAEKQANIIQQGVDRLRNAFASKTGFDIADAFKGGANTADKLLADLKAKLDAAKALQANAAALAGMGYSQVFIEEVVKQGPEAGNKIAEALKAASPEATNQLQELYYGLGDVSKHGLDSLANQMNTSTSFATEEMMNAYNQVSVDLKESLANVNTQMTEALAEANKNYNEALAEAEKNRTEKMADANKALAETLASAKEAYDTALAEASKALLEAREKAQKNLEEGLAEASKALKEAREKAQKDLDEGLADAQKTLQEALLKAQKDYDKAIDEINKSTEKKLADLKDKLKEIAAAMEAISKGSSTGIFNNAPVFAKVGSIIPGIGYDPERKGMTANPYATGNTTNITQNFYDATVNPKQVEDATVNATKYGNAITIGTGKGGGFYGAVLD